MGKRWWAYAASVVALVGCSSPTYVVLTVASGGAEVDALTLTVRDGAGNDRATPQRLAPRQGASVDVLFEIEATPEALTFVATGELAGAPVASCSVTLEPRKGDTTRGTCVLGGAGERPLDRSFQDITQELAPVAWYRLGRDDLGGTVAHDATAAARHGTYGTGARPGAFGALTRDGDTAATVATSQTGVITLAPALVDWNASFTVVLWLNLHHRPPTGERAAVFVQDDGFAMTVDDDQRLHLRSAAGAPVASGDIVPIGRWTMVVIQGTPDDALISTGTTARIGDDDDFPLDAQVDEVLVFDRVLSAAQLELLREGAARGAAAPATCAREADATTITASAAQRIHDQTIQVGAGEVGVRIEGVANVVIEDVRFEVAPGGTAIAITNAAGTRIERVEVRGAGQALHAIGATSLRVRGLTGSGAISLDADCESAAFEDITSTAIASAAAGNWKRVLVESAAEVGLAMTAGSTLEDLDVVGPSLACLTLAGSGSSSIDGLRCRDMSCSSGGNAVRFTGGGTATIEDSSYFTLCGPPTNDGVDYGTGLRVEDFVPRAAPTPTFCWE